MMERIEGQERGTIVLATVKGDVHDIGKNLVDIILTNNGYRVVNLGIKVPLADMVAAVREQNRAHAIGMSGLLVKSTVVMRENLEEMTPPGAGNPGAAGRGRADAQLCRGRLRARLCLRAGGLCARCLRRAASDGQGHRQRLRRLSWRRCRRSASGKARNTARARLGQADARAVPPGGRGNACRRGAGRLTATCRQWHVPPFWGPRVVEAPPKAIVPFVNERSLYQFQWGFRKQGRTLDDFLGWAKQELRPTMRRMLALCEERGHPEAAGGLRLLEGGRDRAMTC